MTKVIHYINTLMNIKFAIYIMKDFSCPSAISCRQYRFTVIRERIDMFNLLRSNIEWVFSFIIFVFSIFTACIYTTKIANLPYFPLLRNLSYLGVFESCLNHLCSLLVLYPTDKFIGRTLFEVGHRTPPCTVFELRTQCVHNW